MGELKSPLPKSHPFRTDNHSSHALSPLRPPRRRLKRLSVVPGLTRDLPVSELDDDHPVPHVSVAVVVDALGHPEVARPSEPARNSLRRSRKRFLHHPHPVPAADAFTRLRHLHHEVIVARVVLDLSVERQHAVREEALDKATLLGSIIHALILTGSHRPLTAARR